VQTTELLQQSATLQTPFQMERHWLSRVALLLTNWMVRFVPQQLSLAVGGSNSQLMPHWTVLLLAQLTTGGVVSFTVTYCVQYARVPTQSVIFQTAEYNALHGLLMFVNTPSCVTVGALVQHGFGPTIGGSNSQAEPHSTDLSAAQAIGVMQFVFVVILKARSRLPPVVD